MMMKHLCFWMAAFCAVSAGALDLMLSTGQSLYNVNVLHQTQQGVEVAANQGYGFSILREVRYNELTPASLRALLRYLHNQNQQLGKSFQPAPGNSMMSAGGAMPGQNSGMMSGGMMSGNIPGGLNDSSGGMSTTVFTPTPQQNAPILPVMPESAANFPAAGPYSLHNPQTMPVVLPGFPHRIFFTSDVCLLNGTLGWANSDDPGGDQNTYFGQMYIYGLQLPQQAVWVGNVYPTNRNIMHNGRFYPCYATSVELARRINRSIQY